MHNCEEFRERITEHIIDREDVPANSEFQRGLLVCSGCAEFYAQSREMMDVLAAVDLTVSARQWNAIDQRLRASILNVHTSRAAVTATTDTRRALRRYMSASVFAACAALLIITIGLSRIGVPKNPRAAAQIPAVVYIEHSVPLDPGTVDFLEESELLLRNVMKIRPADVEDLAEAKKTASEHLAELEQRKEAAADVRPVVNVMDTYETILRDLRNVDDRNAGEDISDLQKRIQWNGMIANMKAFQPRVTEVSFGLK